MSQNTDQVHAFSGLNLYVGGTDATAPTDADTAPTDGEWANLGFLTDDGTGLTPSQETTDITSTQSFYPLLTLVTGRNTDVDFTLLQVSDEAWQLAFGGGSFTGSSGDYEWVPPDPGFRDERSVIIEANDGTVILRVYIPRAVVTTVGAVRFNKGSATEFPITMRILGTSGTDAVQLFTSGYDALIMSSMT